MRLPRELAGREHRASDRYRSRRWRGGEGSVANRLISGLVSLSPPKEAEASGDFYHDWTNSILQHFTTAEKKILENCRCIVPNFMND